ncbi:MAG: acyl-CoA dehydrogenase family protein [Thermodesulfobacteriota bacterium]
MLDFTLSEEQEELKKKARKFALEHVLPVASYYDSIDQTPMEVLKEAFNQNIMNGDIPKEYGGQGHGIVEGSIVTEEIAAACPGVATSIFDNSLGMEPLILSSNEKAKKKYLPLMAKEFKLMSFATSEPTMGSDVSGIKCKAEKDGDDYIINGTKYWVTNGGLADFYTIFATVDSKQEHKGICAFFIERDQEGVRPGKTIPKLGQRCSNTAGVRFDNVRVPAENVLAEPGEGFALAMKTFSRTRPVIGAFATGAARSAMDYAIHYAKKRKAFKSKLAGFQSIQFKIADMYQKVETSRLLVYKSAWEADNKKDPTISASVAKLYTTEVAFEVVDQALQILGGYGYTAMYPVEKIFRDTRLFRIYEGTSEIQRLILGGHALMGYEPVMPDFNDAPVHTEDPLDSNTGKPWRCMMCGHVHYGDEPPEECPYCFFPKGAFKAPGEK